MAYEDKRGNIVLQLGDWFCWKDLEHWLEGRIVKMEIVVVDEENKEHHYYG